MTKDTAAARPEALLERQYNDAAKLEARIALHRRFSTNPHGWNRWLFEQLDPPRSADGSSRILDLGCGSGVLWRDNRERIPTHWRLDLSDVSAGMLDDARSALAGIGAECRFEVIDAQSIPHAADAFDAVLANHMLYHVESRSRALREIAGVLRPGGLLFASTLSLDSMSEMQAVVRALPGREDFWQQRPTAGFVLENGAEQLEPQFSEVRVRRYEDALHVTDAEPVVGYLESLILDAPFTGTELDAIRERVEQEIRRHGAFDVSKDAGVFLARGRS